MSSTAAGAAGVDVARRRRKRSSRVSPLSPTLSLDLLLPSRADLPRLLAAFVIAASVATTLHYCVSLLGRPPKPFCDTSGPITDACEPCPVNGQCFGGKLECNHGYKRYGRICIEDGQISQTARKLSEDLRHRLCQEHAHVLCDGAGKIWFLKADIVKMFDEFRLKENFFLEDDAFTFAKQKAMDIVESSLETRVDLERNKQFKCPEMFAESYKTLVCCIRQWVQRNVMLILGVIVLLAGLLKLFWTVWQMHYISTRAEQLYEEACVILEEAKSMNNGGEPWVVASWLRDHLLLPRERKNTILWNKVEKLILEDTRIEQYPRLIKGEPKIALEWQVGGSLGSKRRKKRAESRALSCAEAEASSNLAEKKFKLINLLGS